MKTIAHVAKYLALGMFGSASMMAILTLIGQHQMVGLAKAMALFSIGLRVTTAPFEKKEQ